MGDMEKNSLMAMRVDPPLNELRYISSKRHGAVSKNKRMSLLKLVLIKNQFMFTIASEISTAPSPPSPHKQTNKHAQRHINDFRKLQVMNTNIMQYTHRLTPPDDIPRILIQTYNTTAVTPDAAGIDRAGSLSSAHCTITRTYCSEYRLSKMGTVLSPVTGDRIKIASSLIAL